MRRLRRLLAMLVALVAVAVVLGELVSGESGSKGGAGLPDVGLDAPDGARSGSVERVVDGDTVVLERIGSSRLIGIDTPEVYGGVECYGREASAYVKRLLPPGRKVRYSFGVDDRDRYGRALIYLWLEDGRSLNGALAAEGYATPLTIPPNVEYEEDFARLARDARRAERGLWAAGACG